MLSGKPTRFHQTTIFRAKKSARAGPVSRKIPRVPILGSYTYIMCNAGDIVNCKIIFRLYLARSFLDLVFTFIAVFVFVFFFLNRVLTFIGGSVRWRDWIEI